MSDEKKGVAVVTGAARGQGRSHAIALATDGADIIGIDRCADIESIPYPLATEDDLDETADLVRACGRRVVTVVADVRNFDDLRHGVDRGISELGDIEVVVANAGVVGMGLTDPNDADVFRDIVDTNLLGVWHTIVATAVGLMRSAAHAYARHDIRVNSVHPTGVATPMIFNDHVAGLFAANPDGTGMTGNLLSVPYVEAIDVTNAVTWLVSEKARYITGVVLPVDAGHAVM